MGQGATTTVDHKVAVAACNYNRVGRGYLSMIDQSRHFGDQNYIVVVVVII